MVLIWSVNAGTRGLYERNPSTILNTCYHLVIQHSHGKWPIYTVDDFPIETTIYRRFSMAILNNQRVIVDLPTKRDVHYHQMLWL